MGSHVLLHFQCSPDVSPQNVGSGFAPCGVSGPQSPCRLLVPLFSGHQNSPRLSETHVGFSGRVICLSILSSAACSASAVARAYFLFCVSPQDLGSGCISEPQRGPTVAV